MLKTNTGNNRILFITPPSMFSPAGSSIDPLTDFLPVASGVPFGSFD
jgi:hypothetical protein